MNMTNDGLCIQEMFIAWLKVMMMSFHMKTIPMKINKDGKNVDQEVGEEILRGSKKY
jgi:hypothetical protein